MLNRKLLKAALQSTPDCLPIEQLELLAADPQLVSIHVANCAKCQAELALLRSFHAESDLPGEAEHVDWISSRVEGRLTEIMGVGRGGERRTQPSRKSMVTLPGNALRGRSWMVAPLVAVMAMVALVLLLRPSREPGLQIPPERRESVLRSDTVQVIAPVGEVSEVPAVLRWNAVPGAKRYHVVIMEVDRSPLWSGEADDVSVDMPASVRDKLLPGKPVLWQVTALDEGGKQLASSGPQRFVVLLPKASPSGSKPSKRGLWRSAARPPLALLHGAGFDAWHINPRRFSSCVTFVDCGLPLATTTP